ncbi:MAG TPA: hypothetical protein VI322_02705 [Candidatus Saccharimonadia bacterium]
MKLFGRELTITRRTAGIITGVLVILPLAYLAGRYGEVSSTGWTHAIGGPLSWAALGALLGLPLGLAVSQLRAQRLRIDQTGQAVTASEVLDQLQAELVENQQLFLARKGSTTLVARLAYVTSFWDTARVTGQLAGFIPPKQLSAIGLAYYWLAQANHLEQLAYDAKNGGVARDAEFTTAKLISEARLLDEPIEKALTTALGAVADLR